MISNQILQNTIEGLKAITRIDLCVMDIEGKVLASTFSNAEDYEKFVLEFVNSPADSQVLQGFQFFKVFDEHQLEFIILARGDSDDVYMIGKVASFQIQNLLMASSSFMISHEFFGSRLPVGSSAKSNGGLFTSALSRATLCCSPPDNSFG